MLRKTLEAFVEGLRRGEMLKVVEQLLKAMAALPLGIPANRAMFGFDLPNRCGGIRTPAGAPRWVEELGATRYTLYGSEGDLALKMIRLKARSFSGWFLPFLPAIDTVRTYSPAETKPPLLFIFPKQIAHYLVTAP